MSLHLLHCTFLWILSFPVCLLFLFLITFFLPFPRITFLLSFCSSLALLFFFGKIPSLFLLFLFLHSTDSKCLYSFIICFLVSLFCFSFIIFLAILSSSLSLYCNTSSWYCILIFLYWPYFSFYYFSAFDVDFERCKICFSAFLCILLISAISVSMILPHTSNPYNMAGIRHISANSIFTFISSDPTLLFPPDNLIKGLKILQVY